MVRTLEELKKKQATLQRDNGDINAIISRKTAATTPKRRSLLICLVFLALLFQFTTRTLFFQKQSLVLCHPFFCGFLWCTLELAYPFFYYYPPSLNRPIIVWSCSPIYNLFLSFNYTPPPSYFSVCALACMIPLLTKTDSTMQVFRHQDVGLGQIQFDQQGYIFGTSSAGSNHIGRRRTSRLKSQESGSEDR